MSEYLKPNAPMYMNYQGAGEENRTYIYPMTTADQVVMDDNKTRLNQIVSNPNLLINPFFTVNQRGQTTYTQTSSVWAKTYTVDMWRIDGSGTITVNVNSDGSLTFTSSTATQSLVQGIVDPKPLLGKTVTLSAIVNGNLYQKSFTLPSTMPTTYETYIDESPHPAFRMRFALSPTSGQAIAYLSNAQANVAFTVRAVKLEYGSVSTLANDHAPDYALELEKCQRYLYPLKGSINLRIRTSWVTPATLQFFVPTGVGLRATPVIIDNGFGVFTLGGGLQSGFTFSLLAFAPNGVLIGATKSNHGLSDAFFGVSNAPYSFLSCEP